MTQQWSLFARAVVLAICLIIIGLAAYAIRPMIAPLIIAGLLAYVLNPLVKTTKARTRLSHTGAVTLVYFLFLAVLIATPSTLIPIFVGQARDLSNDLIAAQKQLQEFLTTPVVVLDRTIHLEEIWANFLSDSAESLAPATEGALEVIETTSVSLLWLLLIVVTAYYFLLDWEKLRDWIISIAPDSEQQNMHRLLHEIDGTWRAYMRGTLALMFIMAIAFTIIGIAIGLPGAAILGLITGLLSMVPEIGPVIAGTIAVLVALIEGSNFLPIENYLFAALVAGIYVVMMQIKTLWLRPHVMGRFMHMNTGFVFVAIIAAVVLQGILAALIVLPILATIGIIGRYLRARLLNLDPWPETPPPPPLREPAAVPAPVTQSQLEIGD
jgi:predicted PurR-regulated permease PerM